MVCCLKGFIGDCNDSPSEIFNKLSRLRAPCATRFHSDCNKYMGGRQITVLDQLLSESFSAAAPAEILVAWMWDAAYVSESSI